MASTVTPIPGATSSQTLLEANPQRTGCSFYYDGASPLYLKAGADGSAADFTVKMGDGALTFYEPTDPNYTGPFSGAFGAATGTLFVTEFN